MRRLIALTIVAALACASCGGDGDAPTQAEANASLCLHLGGLLAVINSPAYPVTQALGPDALAVDVRLLRQAGLDERAARVEELAAELERMHERNESAARVYLEDGFTPSTLAAIRSEIQGIDGVTIVGFESKEEAFKRFKELFHDQPDLIENTNPDALPASFLIRLPTAQSEDINQQLEAESGVEDVVPQLAVEEPGRLGVLDTLMQACAELALPGAAPKSP